ncbi:NUDIX hydrolase [Aquamicrobium sp. LC103]|uniref:NUDIX hydrolase n=1 Tax=Aquamicrobium sp. LC103 TaxID=1120658 RepID=UPI000AE4F2AB|nr:NUDIX hydrolase [Aquamicrobium sp. LC103]TKT81320.1 NUDIX domain-containing protein [Aquamicrobium sp. LC103]
MPSAPQRAVSAAIFDKGRFLLVRRGRPPAFGLYAFPGGRVEEGETLENAVRREVMEETGAMLREIRHVVDLEVGSEEEEQRIEFILSVHAAAFAGGTIQAGDDADAAGWFTIEEMEPLPLAGSVLEIARQLAAEPRPASNEDTPCSRSNSDGSITQ